MTNVVGDSVNPVFPCLRGETSFAFLARAKELAAQGRKIISFGIGQPDFPTPWHIVEAAKTALDEGFTGYTETAGIAELREAIAEYLNNRYGCDVRSDEVIVTPGTKTALFLGFSAFLRPGNEVIVPDPCYWAYADIPEFLGARPVFVPIQWLGSSKGFRLNISEIESLITSRTKMIVLNNPHNPVGVTFTPDEVEQLAELAKRYNLILLADEVYDNFVYDVKFRSVLSDPEWRDYVIYANGFSKTFSMTGWRLGYLVVRRDVCRDIVKFATNVYSCPNSFAQKGAVVALRGDWGPVRKMVEAFRERRDLIFSLLRKVPGFEVWKPTGAFYVFPRVARILEMLKLTTWDFAKILLEKYGVVVLPGSAFPERGGDGFIRMSYATSPKNIREGIKIIMDAINDLESP